jgi:hypothetical protein
MHQNGRNTPKNKNNQQKHNKNKGVVIAKTTT